MAWVKDRPCAESRTTCGGPACAAFDASRCAFGAIPSDASASANGSGFSTIPSPPPKGRSSTVRCRSCVKARRSCTPTDTSPSASARRSIPFSKKLVKNSGKIVTISKRILFDDTAVAWFPPRTPVRRGARFPSEAVVLEGNIHVEVEGLLRSVLGVLHFHHVVGVTVLIHQALLRGHEAQHAQDHIFLVDVDHHPSLLQ